MNERELLTQCYPLVVHAARLAPDLYADLKERIDAALHAPAPAKQEQAEARELALDDEKIKPLFYEWSHEASPYDGFSPTRERTVEVLLRAYKLGKSEAAALLTRQSEAQEKEWVPISERLPKGADAVMCIAWCKAIEEGAFPGPCLMTFDSNGEWMSRQDSGCWEPGEVTHWQSLPTSPAQSGKEGK